MHLAVINLPDRGSLDPLKWADAMLALLKGGGWIVPALIALWIVLRWWPWRRKGQ